MNSFEIDVHLRHIRDAQERAAVRALHAAEICSSGSTLGMVEKTKRFVQCFKPYLPRWLGHANDPRPELR